MIDRYSNPEIKKIWDLQNKYEIWKEIEILACEARNYYGELSEEDFQTIKKRAKFDVNRILELESKLHHDVLAFLTNLNESIGESGKYVHYGLTSSDIGDTALCLQMKQSADILLNKIQTLLEVTKEKSLLYKNLVCIGRSHGVHAEPMTLGLKFAFFYEEMKRNRERLLQAREEISVGKFSGAVGTYSNISPKIEKYVLKKLNLKAEPISTQIIPRDRHAFYMSVLGIIASSLDRMATEIRLLQKTEGREVEEPFSKGQKGSSAMPHKKNPVICERISGISRVIRSNVQAAFQNVVLWHERDISHSSAERIILPDVTVSLDYILDKMSFVLKNLQVYPENIQDTFEKTQGLIFSQKVLLALVEEGKYSREDAYLIVQESAMKTWQKSGLSFKENLKQDKRVSSCLSKDSLDTIFQVEPYLQNVDLIYERLGLN